MNTNYPLLVVDDDPEERYLLHLAMADIGWEKAVQFFPSAESLLRHLALLPPAAYPSLLLLDYHMPGINGMQLIELLKESESFRYLPVIVYSSNLLPDIRQMLLEQGALCCCNKVQDYKGALAFAESLRQLCMSPKAQH